MLFSILPDSERKSASRLPPVWRDFFNEMVTIRRSEIDQADKTVLKTLQSIIERSSTNHISATQPDRADVTMSNQQVNGLRHQSIVLGEDNLKMLMHSKMTAPSYTKMLHNRQLLPVWNFKSDILAAINSQQVTIISAETGAGKSTQTPTYILEHALSHGRDCRIFVSQPRRISAITLAKRVSEELGEVRVEIGSSLSMVGYAIRLETKVSTSTRITFGTTGVLLRMLESSHQLDHITHLILDEIHERTMDLDLLFIVIKRMLVRRPSLKIILMSATVQAAKFVQYFEGAQALQIPGRTFPVEVRYLEDAVELTKNTWSKQHERSLPASEDELEAQDDQKNDRVKALTLGLEGYSKQTKSLLSTFDEYHIEYDLITALAAAIATSAAYKKYSKAILIFMPGIAEIRRLYNIISAHPTFSHECEIHMLHSSFSSEDLERAFLVPSSGMRKIVIATNIAETGITIPDVTAVIDTCKEKTMRFDERRQLSKLTESFISRSSSRQRRGRAARVQDGLCFHMVTRYRFDNIMAEEHVPEMLRLSLQDPILRIKVWDLGDIETTLAQAIDPPNIKNTRRAIIALQDAGALTSSEKLTTLGRQLSRLPLDILLGKLVILGLALSCLDAAVTIAAIVSSKSPFQTYRGQIDPRADAARLRFARADSDLLLAYNAYLAWRRASEVGSVFEFCRKNFLDTQTLSQIEEQKTQLLVNMADSGLLQLDSSEKADLQRARISGRKHQVFAVPARFDGNSGLDMTLNTLIADAFYPKLLSREGKSYRNFYTNQHVSLAPTSINRYATKPPRWLSFYQAMQTKSGNLNVFETSPVPESAIILLFGDASFKLFAGVIEIDSGKIRFVVKDWKTMMALKMLRGKLSEIMANFFKDPQRTMSKAHQKWWDIWMRILNPKAAETLA